MNAKSEISWKIWLIFFWLNLRASFGNEKYWLPNLEWENAENWIGKRVPELDSYVTFPLDMRHVAGIGKSDELSLSGIDLPRSGSLALSKNGKLKLSDSKKLPRKISEWSRSGHLFWADPQNWNGSCEATPHLEQVPCRQDDIVLPEKDRAFSVLLPMKSIEVRSIRAADEKHPFSAWQWADFENRREFEKGLFTVNYAEYTCDKCPCQEDPYGYYLEEICAIQRPKCGFIPCEFPLTVEGHCCYYCGGRVSLTNKASLPMVRAAADEALEGYGEKLAWHVRRSSNGPVEVLIKEKGDYSGIDIMKAAENVKRTMTNMKIEILAVEVSGAALQNEHLTATLVPLFLTPFFVLALAFLTFLYFGYSYRQILMGCREMFSSIRDGVLVDKTEASKPFGFARFENISEGNVRIASPENETEQKLEDKGGEGEGSSGGRFENPLYRSKRKGKEEGEVLDMNAAVSLTALKTKVEDQIEEVEVDIDE
ncbi:protein amnionless [Xylocopa sonorina]|uniref:protein amnionless n=1 Tax=Xylocopa sonorina TaxID=1818115 RepID=UPI00403B0DD2